jgi:hypothetical protein
MGCTQMKKPAKITAWRKYISGVRVERRKEGLV